MADLKLLTICGSLRKGSYNQYDLRRAMVFLDAFTLNKPEIFIGSYNRRDQGRRNTQFH